MSVYVQRGYLVMSFFYKGVRHREYLQELDTPANRKEAERKYKLISHQIKGKTFKYEEWFPNSPRAKQFSDKPPLSDMTVGAYLTIWHQRRCPLRPDGTAKPNFDGHLATWVHDKGTVENILKPALGRFRLRDLTPLHIKQLKAELEDTRAGQTVAKILYLLSGCLREAVEDRLITESPMIKLKRVKPNPVPRRLFTAQERQAILAALPDRLNLDSGAHITKTTLTDLYEAWFLLGLRDSEILGLKFHDVDTREQVINIRRGRSNRRNPITLEIGFEDDPKNGSRKAPIGWAPSILAMIERRKRESLQLGKREYIFTDSHAQPLNQETLSRRVWNPTLRSLGIATDESVSDRSSAMYGVRHGAVTGMIAAGVPLPVISKIVGTSREQIFRSYLNVEATMDTNTGRKYVEQMTLGSQSDLPASLPASGTEPS